MCCYEPTSDPLHPRSEHTREVQITATGRRPTARLSSCELSLSLSLFSHRTGTRTQLLPPAMLSNIRCLAFALVMGLLAVASGEIGRVQASSSAAHLGEIMCSASESPSPAPNAHGFDCASPSLPNPSGIRRSASSSHSQRLGLCADDLKPWQPEEVDFISTHDTRQAEYDGGIVRRIAKDAGMPRDPPPSSHGWGSV